MSNPSVQLNGASTTPLEALDLPPRGSGAPAAAPHETGPEVLRGGRPSPALPRASLKYFFSIECALDSTTPPPIEIPGGARLQANIVPAGSRVSVAEEMFAASWKTSAMPRCGDVTAQERSAIEKLLETKSRLGIRETLKKVEARGREELRHAGLDWPGINGSVQSGADSIFVREDGVVVFDGRFTIKADNDFLLGVNAAGLLDLKGKLEPPVASGPAAYAAYRSAVGDKVPFPSNGELPIRLSLRFEATAGPGAAADWAASRYVLQSLGHWKYDRLVRSEFVGLGTLTVKRARNWPVEKLVLHVFELDSHLAQETSASWAS